MAANYLADQRRRNPSINPFHHRSPPHGIERDDSRAVLAQVLGRTTALETRLNLQAEEMTNMNQRIEDFIKVFPQEIRNTWKNFVETNDHEQLDKEIREFWQVL